MSDDTKNAAYWRERALRAEGWAGAAECDHEASAGLDGGQYVILDARTIVGNTPLFWMPNGNGYGSVITDVGRYSKEYAESLRDTDIPIPLALAVSCARPRIDIQLLNRELEIAGRPLVHIGFKQKRRRA